MDFVDADTMWKLEFARQFGKKGNWQLFEIRSLRYKNDIFQYISTESNYIHRR